MCRIAGGSKRWVESEMGWGAVIVSVVLEIVLVECRLVARWLVVRVYCERERWIRRPGLS